MPKVNNQTYQPRIKEHIEIAEITEGAAPVSGGVYFMDNAVDACVFEYATKELSDRLPNQTEHGAVQSIRVFSYAEQGLLEIDYIGNGWRSTVWMDGQGQVFTSFASQAKIDPNGNTIDGAKDDVIRYGFSSPLNEEEKAALNQMFYFFGGAGLIAGTTELTRHINGERSNNRDLNSALSSWHYSASPAINYYWPEGVEGFFIAQEQRRTNIQSECKAETSAEKTKTE